MLEDFQHISHVGCAGLIVSVTSSSVWQRDAIIIQELAVFLRLQVGNDLQHSIDRLSGSQEYSLYGWMCVHLGKSAHATQDSLSACMSRLLMAVS